MKLLSDVMVLPYFSTLEDYFYCFLVIRNSGIVQFAWYSNEELEKKWGPDEILLSGFLTALNAIGQVFFENNRLKSISFDNYNITFAQDKFGNLLALISAQYCPDIISQDFIKKIKNSIDEINLNQNYVNITFNERINTEFLKLLNEFSRKIELNSDSNQIKSSEFKYNSFNEEKRINSNELRQDVANTLTNTFNNILSIILGNISLAKMEAAPKSEQMECLEEAESSCSRVKALTSLLIDVGRINEKK